MMRRSFKRFLNTVVTFSVVVVLMIGNATSVAAYTDLNGYPMVMDGMECTLYEYTSSGDFKAAHYFPGELHEQNSYLFNLDYSVTGVRTIRFGLDSGSLIVPLNLDIYDYYLIGTVFFDDKQAENSGIELAGAYFYNTDVNGERQYVNVNDFKSMDFIANDNGFGKSFYGKIQFLGGNANLAYLILDTPSMGNVNSNIWFSASIVPVAKSGTEANTLNSILQTLNQINQNLIINNTLQQQTIDAIIQNTTNTSNWFTTLITTMQGWYNTQTENLRTWFYMIEERMSAGFTALYHQMTKEQDEKLNGYEGTSTPDANEEFNAGSSELVSIEGELSDTSSQYVNDFTATGFDSSALTAIGSSLLFVTTWFTNFWNMGGIWTAGLNICFALSIAFFVLKRR